MHGPVNVKQGLEVGFTA